MKIIEILRNRLSANNTLFVQNEHGIYQEVSFEFYNPITIEHINNFELSNNIVLPDSYKEFLQISNGAILFRDIKYDQWGCKILSIEELINKTNYIKKIGYNIKESWIVFAEWLGDGDTLLFDLERLKDYIIDGDSGYNTNKWEYLNGNFENFLDRLIVSQGSKYWRW